jgi:pilus assembly protein TadC
MGLSIYLLFFFSSKTYPIIYVFIAIVVIWILIFFLLLALIWLCFYLFLDVQIFKRTRSVEEVLPDFLQLTATNVRAGMTIDKALWFAIRPRFGILAKEIETVAKEVMSGEELTDALQRFSDKYNSGILKESINLMIEGINAGSEIGDLLSRISQNIQEVNTIQKEMAANVTSYVIFITFSAIIASPILLALSKQLIVIIDQLVKSIGPLPRQSMLSLTQMGISAADFHFFAVTSTAITSICSAMMISVIKKGNVKEGLKYIPTFLVIALVLYYLSLKVMGAAFGNLFG